MSKLKVRRKATKLLRIENRKTGDEAKCRASEKQMRRNYVVTSPFITIPVGGISSTAKTVTFLVNLNFMNLWTIDGVQDGASVV